VPRFNFARIDCLSWEGVPGADAGGVRSPYGIHGHW
jgi:hypothetical protein